VNTIILTVHVTGEAKEKEAEFFELTSKIFARSEARQLQL